MRFTVIELEIVDHWNLPGHENLRLVITDRSECYSGTFYRHHDGGNCGQGSNGTGVISVGSVDSAGMVPRASLSCRVVDQPLRDYTGFHVFRATDLLQPVQGLFRTAS